MKLVILAVLAIFILGGGAAGAYFYFGQPAQASIGETPEHQKAAEAKQESSDAHGGGGNHGKFVELSPLILPVLDEGGISQVVSIVVVIEVEGDENEKMVLALEPRLKDAYIQELYGVLNRHAVMEGGVLQVGAIKEHLARISDKVLGEGVVKGVLLQLVQQRPV